LAVIERTSVPEVGETLELEDKRTVEVVEVVHTPLIREWDGVLIVREKAAKVRVLIVEDDEGVQEYLRNTLSGAGYESEIARDGDEAMAMMRSAPAGLVIVDLFMPRKGGFQTITALRQEWPNAKVLAISGGGHYAGGDALLVASRVGAHGTLAKPFTPDQLLAQVNRLV